MASVPNQFEVSAQCGRIMHQIARLKEKLRNKDLPNRTFESLLAKFDKLTAQLSKLTAQQTRRETRK